MKAQIMRFKLDDGAYEPERAHSTDSGMDLRSPIDIIVRAKSSAVIDTGVHPEIVQYAEGVGSSGILLPKSGLNVKNDILSFGVIDEGYSGSIVVKLYNLGDHDYHVHRGDKITQLIIADVRYVIPKIVYDIDSGDRGDNGFGSTGR